MSFIPSPIYYIIPFAGIPTNLSDEEFILLLKMVCKKRKVESSRIKQAEEYLKMIGQRQAGILTHENLNASDCPKFDSTE